MSHNPSGLGGEMYPLQEATQLYNITLWFQDFSLETDGVPHPTGKKSGFQKELSFGKQKRTIMSQPTTEVTYDMFERRFSQLKCIRIVNIWLQ